VTKGLWKSWGGREGGREGGRGGRTLGANARKFGVRDAKSLLCLSVCLSLSHKRNVYTREKTARVVQVAGLSREKDRRCSAAAITHTVAAVE
jgi:hypothetical protein